MLKNYIKTECRLQANFIVKTMYKWRLQANFTIKIMYQWINYECYNEINSIQQPKQHAQQSVNIKHNFWHVLFVVWLFSLSENVAPYFWHRKRNEQHLKSINLITIIKSPKQQVSIINGSRVTSGFVCECFLLQGGMADGNVCWGTGDSPALSPTTGSLLSTAPW